MRIDNRFWGLTMVFWFGLLFLFAQPTAGQAAEPVARAPVRISVKFILDVNGNRPATGNLNTDEEILQEIRTGIEILRETWTEFTIDLIYFADLPGVSQWSGVDASMMDFLRTQALQLKQTYAWDDRAINIYINGGQGSAQSSYPPENDIILMNQLCANNPSCILHELGHSLNLKHTHESDAGGDECADTLEDSLYWTKDQLSAHNFGGRLFLQLTPEEQEQVNLTFNNIMSYHVKEPQRRLSPCQKDRISLQASADRGRLFDIDPIWVSSLNCVPGSSEAGSFDLPFCSLDKLFEATEQATAPLDLNNKVIVLEGESPNAYLMSPRTIRANVGIISRNGPAKMATPGARTYVLPIHLEHSKNTAVANAIRRVQDEDTLARKALETGKQAEAAIRAEAETQSRQHAELALQSLLQAEKHASGDERLAIQHELAQRYRDAGDYERAADYFERVAAETDQQGLKEESGKKAAELRRKAKGIGQKGAQR